MHPQPNITLRDDHFAASGSFHFEQSAISAFNFVHRGVSSTRNGPDLKVFLTDGRASAVNGQASVLGTERVDDLQSEHHAQRHRLSPAPIPITFSAI
jgi:hypothetical protein